MTTDLHLLFEHINDAIFALDSAGYITDVNPAGTKLLGYSVQELKGKHISVVYDDKKDLVKCDYELSLALKNNGYISEGWRTRADDSKFWGELSIVPLLQKGEASGFVCTLHDVSARKKYELDLRYNEERFRLMVQGIKDYAIFMLDPLGNILTWNDGARKIKGYTASEIIGKHFSNFYIAEDLEDGKPQMELKIAAKIGKYEEQGWRIKKDGSLFWANVVITALFNEQNKLIGFSKVTRDITDQRERDEQLRQTEEKYRLLVEQVTDYGIFMMDDSGRIISWNEGAKRINGYTEQEIIGKFFSVFYTEEDIINGKPSYELRVAITEGKYVEEGWRIRKDGSRFWANVVITAVYNKEGALVGFSKVTRDLTERKESEKLIKQTYERYRLLAEELKVTNAELSQANAELEQYTSIVSHDLQEPVRAIKSFLQLIDTKVSAEANEDLKLYIGKSINAANRMKELIHNLLAYSQLGKSEIVRKQANVDEIIGLALQNLKPAIDAANARMHINNTVITINCDSMQVIQLIQNLVGNALKFTGNNLPEINVTCSRENGLVKFAVADNGIGIAPRDSEKIFEIFKRLNTEKEYPGTGIGLAICKKIVDRHNGKIWLESEPGKGTTFYFTLN